MSRPLSALALAIAVLAPDASAQNLSFYVDGLKGSDVPANGRSATNAWKTITYAFTQITAPTLPSFHTIHVAGSQVYSPGTNGETLPIRPKANVGISGAPGTTRPVIQIPPGQTGIVMDPDTAYERNESKMQNLVFRGGAYGVRIGGNAGFRHRPKVDESEFTGQSQAGIRIDTQARNVDGPRIFHCRFANSPRGIWCTATGVDAFMVPDVDECTFEDLTDQGVFVSDTAATGSVVGGLVRFSTFNRCGKGVHLMSVGGAPGSRMTVLSCFFTDCVQDGIHVEAFQSRDPIFTAESCSFLRGMRGLRFDGTLAQGAYVMQVRNNVARGQTQNGFRYEFLGTGTVRVVSEENLATGVAGSGYAVLVPSLGIQLTMDSRRDRSLANGAHGMVIQGGNQGSALNLHCDIFAGNGMSGLDLWPGAMSAEVRWLTIADNRAFGLTGVFSTATTLIDHCIFSRNRAGEVNVLAGTRIEFSAFETTSYAGRGNLSGDPGLVRPFYKITRFSQARDAGNAGVRAPLLDYEGDPRVAPGVLRPDLGADEWVPYGSARPFGVSGFGAGAFQPVIASSGSPVQIGGSIRVDLRRAEDYGHYLAAAGILFMGTSEDASPLPFDLSVAGAPGSFLWQNLAFTVAVVPVTTGGSAEVTVPIPQEYRLIGTTFVFQWLVPKLGATPGHFVTTQGLRVTIDA